MVRKIGFVLCFIGLVVLVGCTSKKSEKARSEQEEIIRQQKLAQGLKLLELNCYSCHSPNADMNNRLAPPMIAIKKYYITEEASREQFTRDIIKFLKNPIEENAKMLNAVEKFGVMPKMEFSDEDLTLMAHYLFDNEIEQPEWFEKHFQEEYGKEKNAENQNKALSYKDKGLQYALNTKKVLGKNLINTINNKGTEGALQFCNENAIHFTDSMAVQQGVKIKRVSDQPRNASNQASPLELEYINAAKSTLANGDVIKPLVSELNNKIVGYYPIVTNKMCLQCHGEPNEEIKLATLQKIMELYPKDEAKGYDENQLRGIWVVEMDKE